MLTGTEHHLSDSLGTRLLVGVGGAQLGLLLVKVQILRVVQALYLAGILVLVVLVVAGARTRLLHLALVDIGVLLVLSILALISLSGQRFNHIILVVLRESSTHGSESMGLYRTSAVTLASCNPYSISFIST